MKVLLPDRTSRRCSLRSPRYNACTNQRPAVPGCGDHVDAVRQIHRAVRGAGSESIIQHKVAEHIPDHHTRSDHVRRNRYPEASICGRNDLERKVLGLLPNTGQYIQFAISGQVLSGLQEARIAGELCRSCVRSVIGRLGAGVVTGQSPQVRPTASCPPHNFCERLPSNMSSAPYLNVGSTNRAILELVDQVMPPPKKAKSVSER